MKFLKQVQESLESLNGYRMPYAVQDFLVPSKNTDQLLIKESSDEAEVLICLQETRLEKLSKFHFPNDFHLDLLPDLGVVIEELSHFNTYCLSALQNREISSLELEVQGEIDRFGVALDFLHQKNESDLREQVFDLLFSDLQTGAWVKPEDEERYRDAHRLAKNFCRSILERRLEYPQMQQEFRGFFLDSPSRKLAPKY